MPREAHSRIEPADIRAKLAASMVRKSPDFGSLKKSGSVTRLGSNPARISSCFFCLKVSVLSNAAAIRTKAGQVSAGNHKMVYFLIV
jgi:hypothetical protein